MGSLIFLIIFAFLVYLALFTTVLDALIKKLPAIPVPKNNHRNSSKQEEQKSAEAAQQKRRKRARAAAKLYIGSNLPDLGGGWNDGGSDSSSNSCGSNHTGGDSGSGCDF
jgi:Na+-transporting methylmalonyl-CoA/oxaloacetate decarboxylase gamma subunit